MRRHFVEHDEVEVFVATTGRFDEPNIPALLLQNPQWLDRLGRTRLWRWVRNFEMLAVSRLLPRELTAAAEQFQPDAIFTVADLTLSEAARRLAKHLNVPLISNFQDWWPRGQFYYSAERPFDCLVPVFEARFRRLFQESALVFCTSEGMKEYLGLHPNSHVLYPIGAKQILPTKPVQSASKGRSKRRLLYTGTAFGSYGAMLRELASRLEFNEHWELVIYGAKPDWPADELSKAEANGLYRGFLPFEQLKSEIATADACLAVMSFDTKLEVMMRTSFTTKVLDYCSGGKPIIVWGPDFCSPVRLCQKKGAALTVDSPDSRKVLDCLQRLSNETGLSDELANAALALAANELSHDVIHQTFVREIARLTSA
jgi:hypothetical protein